MLLAQGKFREQVAEITGGALAIWFTTRSAATSSTKAPAASLSAASCWWWASRGRIADISTNIPLIKGFTVVGVRAGEYARRFPERGKAIRDAMTGWRKREAHSRIDRVLPLARWREGFEAMARREVIGKVVLVPGA